MLRSILSLTVRPGVTHYANYSARLPEQLVAFQENQDMVVCWHPEPEIPYEFTKPLPVKEAKPSDSVLRIGDKEIAEAFQTMKPEVVIEKLSEMTYTTKHIWYPRSRDKRTQKIEMDRPYL